jgi:hypothetical protein
MKESHAIATAKRHSRLAGDLPQAFGQQRRLVTLQVCTRKDCRRPAAYPDGEAQLFLEHGVGHHQHDEIGGRRQVGERGIALETQYLRLVGVDRIDLALESAGEGLGQRRPSEGARPLRCADDRDGSRLQERLQPLRSRAYVHGIELKSRALSGTEGRSVPS